ncbi:MAG: hypothetical protein KKF44_10525 [Nanoarchaeota archaeon]|nr:hypothetical protein [Nanoarchaeota archaeon]
MNYILKQFFKQKEKNIPQKSFEKEPWLDRKIESLYKKLSLIKHDLIKRDLLFNLSRIKEGDYIISFRRTGGGLLCLDKNNLSIKRLDEIFGYYEVNNNILRQRHKIIKETLTKYGLIQDDNLIEATFKTDTYFIRKTNRLEEITWAGIKKNSRFCNLSDSQVIELFSRISLEVKKQMLNLIQTKLEAKNITIENPIYTITCGLDDVKRSYSPRLFLEKKYYEWRPFFWQRIAKSNSMKAAILAELNQKEFMRFSKPKIDNLVEEIYFLNKKLSKENSHMMERYSKYKVMKLESVQGLRNICSKDGILENHTAIEYFDRLKILEEIITYPESYADAINSFKKTSKFVKDIESSLAFLDKCKTMENLWYETKRKISDIEVLSKKAISSLNIDYKNPDFNSEIKFFQKSSNLKIGKYYFLYLDIKNAGLLIRKNHEKKLLKYHSSGFDQAEFIKLCFNSYDEFIKLIASNQIKIKNICDKHLKGEEVLFLAFGDEIFVLMPETRKTNQVINEIKKSLELNVRIVSTYFDIDEQINEIGSGKVVINAFEAIKYGNKVIKDYERVNDNFTKIVLIDPEFSHKILDELSESVERM